MAHRSSSKFIVSVLESYFLLFATARLLDHRTLTLNFELFDINRYAIKRALPICGSKLNALILPEDELDAIDFVKRICNAKNKKQNIAVLL